MPSFDIVSKTDWRRSTTRSPIWRGRSASATISRARKRKVERKEAELTLHADDELKLKQMHELLQGHFARRKVDASASSTMKRSRRRPDKRCGRRPSFARHRSGARQAPDQGDQGLQAQGPGHGPGRRAAGSWARNATTCRR